MKRLRNTSGLDDSLVKNVVNWIAEELGITAFDVECRKSSGTVAGMAYSKGSAYHTSARPFVVLRIGTDLITRFQYTENGNKHIALKRSWLRNVDQSKIIKVSTKRFPTTITPYQYGQHKGKKIILWSRTEALVYVAAHELRHLWQAARMTDRRKSAKLQMAYGSKGVFSEIDTEAFAIKTLRQWRSR